MVNKDYKKTGKVTA